MSYAEENRMQTSLSGQQDGLPTMELLEMLGEYEQQDEPWFLNEIKQQSNDSQSKKSGNSNEDVSPGSTDTEEDNE